MKAFIKKIENNKLLQAFLGFYQSAETDVTSIAVAYYLLISILPILMILANMIPYFHIDTTEILSLIKGILPRQFYTTVKGVIENVLNKPSSGLLSISVLSAIWTFSRVLTMLQKAFNKAYGVTDHRDFILSRLMGVLTSIGLQLIVALTIFLTIFGQSILKLLHHYWDFNDQVYRSLLNLTQPTLVLSMTLSLMMLYLTLPNVKIKKIRYILPGTAFVTFVLVALSNLFGIYVEMSMNRMSDFRFLGMVVVFATITWFIFLAKMLIFGAILNATYQFRKEGAFQMRESNFFHFFSSKNR